MRYRKFDVSLFFCNTFKKQLTNSQNFAAQPLDYTHFKEVTLMSYSTQVKSTLLNDISEMATCPWLFSKHPEQDFSRKRKIDFETLMHLIIAMEGGTIKHELFKYFDYDTNILSVSAFYQQRRKLLLDAFQYLLQQFNSHFPLEKYKDKYQLIACDGSEFNITRNPNDPDTFHQPNGKSSRGFNMLHVTALYDLLGRRYLDAIIQPGRKKNEFRAICDLIDRYSTNHTKPIFIADRGFSSFNVFAHAMEKGSYFLIRAKDVNVQHLLNKQDLNAPDEFDTTVERILTRTQSIKKRLHPQKSEQYNYIGHNASFDYIESGTTKEYPLTLRIIRVKITEDSYENIITNLPSEEFSDEEIMQLYNLRWGIETSFRELKHTIGAINFHSKKVEYINQEIWARLILYNFCEIITTHVVIEKKDTKHTYQVNYSMAIKICHHFFRLHSGETPPDIEGLISSNILPVRPGRTFARQHRFKPPASFPYRFS